MAVTHDVGVSAGNVLSWSHTCSGSNRYLTVEVMIGSATITGTAVTYNSVGMTFLGRSVFATLPITAEIWGLVNPAAGANTVAVTLSGANPGSDNGSASFQGVDPNSPTGGSPASTNGTASTPAVSGTETGRSGIDMLVACCGASKALTVVAPSAGSWNSGVNGDACAYRLSDGTSQTVSWNLSVAGNWATEVVLLQGLADSVNRSVHLPFGRR